MDDIEGEIYRQYINDSMIGEIFEWQFNFEQLEEYILKPIEMRAFLDFAEIDVSDTNRLILCKAIKLGIDRVRSKIQERINMGKNARQQLIIEYSTRKDENDG